RPRPHLQPDAAAGRNAALHDHRSNLQSRPVPLGISFDDQGSGDPVVLVHGTTGSRLHWLLQAPALAARFRVVLPEYAGSGETPDPGRPLEVDDLVDQVAAVTDHLGLDRYHLGGWSLGAVVAAAVAAA